MSHRRLAYLRKSRQDDPNMSVEDVLATHEAILQEYAEKVWGHPIPEENIYREIGSGESIADRVKIKEVLARIEDPDIVGVLVVEPSRLSRGDFNDCGTLMQAFRLTNTQVVTPTMTYDLSKKMESKFLQSELLRGNDYLEYTKEILHRGIDASVKRGCFLGSIAPYGYDKVKDGKNCTLRPNKDADTVRLIFDLYVNELLTPGQIAKRLTEMGVPAPGGKKWWYEAIYRMLQNPHYIGKVRRYYKKRVQVIEFGEKVAKRLTQPESEHLVIDGLHPAIIDVDTFNAAQERVAGYAWTRYDRALKNPLGGLLYCKYCGKAMARKPKARDGAHERVDCPSSPVCCKGTALDNLVEAVAFTLEHSELPALREKMESHGVGAILAQRRVIEKLEKQMEDYRKQEEVQFEMLELGRYTIEQFDQRNTLLHDKMDECEQEIKAARAAMPRKVNYEERILSLEKAIEALKDDAVSIDTKNALLRVIVDRIEYSSTGSGRGDTQIHLDVFLKL